jgi:hypothetical protein
MVVGNYQEAKFYTASYKHNKKRKLKSRERGGKFFVFLVSFFFNLREEGNIVVFLTTKNLIF